LKTELAARADVLRFVVLVPHRDNTQQLRAYSEKLFAAGLAGAYSFPNVAPLARVSRAFSREELKALARALRSWTLADGNDGKLRTGAAQSVSCPAGAGRELTLFGAALEPARSAPQGALLTGGHFALDLQQDALMFCFPRLILSAALLGRGDERLVAALPPLLSFRAAMVANMTLTRLGCGAAAYSFAWQVGEPAWLPAASPQEERPIYRRKFDRTGAKSD
jgi:hypothetical protein